MKKLSIVASLAGGVLILSGSLAAVAGPAAQKVGATVTHTTQSQSTDFSSAKQKQKPKGRGQVLRKP